MISELNKGLYRGGTPNFAFLIVSFQVIFTEVLLDYPSGCTTTFLSPNLTISIKYRINKIASSTMDATRTNYYPMMASPDYSPVSETFPLPDQFESFSDGYPYPKRDATPFDTAFSHIQQSNTQNITTNGWPNFGAPTFRAMPDDTCEAFPTARLPNGLFVLSPLPSPNGGSPEAVIPIPVCGPIAGSLSPRSLSPESPTSDTAFHRSEQEVKPAPRKRGRPRLNRRSTTDGSSSSISAVPHKQVERKYREGLNMEFERLRRAVPTLPQSIEANIMGAAKPSKGMVLAAAIDYIGRLERERDAAMDEVERLGGNVRMGRF
jgi:hypothetical protein